jgi:hypothetical protein
MFNKEKIGVFLAGATLAATLVSPSSQAATGSVDVDITFPPLIIFYYYPNIEINVDADDLESVLINGNAGLGSCAQGASGTVSELECETAENPKVLSTGTVSSTTITYDADISSDSAVSGVVDPSVSFTLTDVWAVRALATSLTASVATGGGDFTNESITPTSPTPQLFPLTSGVNVGDLSFDVDMSSLVGLTASDTLTVTVVSP